MAACRNTFISPYPFVGFINVRIIVPKTFSLCFFLIMVMLYPDIQPRQPLKMVGFWVPGTRCSSQLDRKSSNHLPISQGFFSDRMSINCLTVSLSCLPSNSAGDLFGMVKNDLKTNGCCGDLNHDLEIKR